MSGGDWMRQKIAQEKLKAKFQKLDHSKKTDEKRSSSETPQDQAVRSSADHILNHFDSFQRDIQTAAAGFADKTWSKWFSSISSAEARKLAGQPDTYSFIQTLTTITNNKECSALQKFIFDQIKKDYPPTKGEFSQKPSESLQDIMAFIQTRVNALIEKDPDTAAKDLVTAQNLKGYAFTTSLR